MFIPFRQGVVSCPVAGQTQQFLSITQYGITLDTSLGDLVVTFAYKQANYLHVEHKTTLNAWLKPAQITTYWLYIELDMRTGARTFGTTNVAPSVSTSEPQGPLTNQIWYDPTSKITKTFKGTSWVDCLRVVVAKVESNTIKAWNGSNSYTGSQINDNTSSEVGSILFDDTNRPLRKNDTFITTTDFIYSSTTNVSSIRVENLNFRSEADTNMAAFTVVQFSDFGKIIPAGSVGVFDNVVGIIEKSVTTGQLINVTPQGIITNPAWDWSKASQPLWYDQSGLLTETPRPGINPVAFVVEKTKVLFTPRTVNAPEVTNTELAVRTYVPAQGIITIDEDIGWHMIEQTGPITIKFNAPTRDNLIRFTVEIISNGADVYWEMDDVITQCDAGITDIHHIVYRPARGNSVATFFRERTQY